MSSRASRKRIRQRERAAALDTIARLSDPLAAFFPANVRPGAVFLYHGSGNPSIDGKTVRVKGFARMPNVGTVVVCFAETGEPFHFAPWQFDPLRMGQLTYVVGQ